MELEWEIMRTLLGAEQAEGFKSYPKRTPWQIASTLLEDIWMDAVTKSLRIVLHVKLTLLTFASQWSTHLEDARIRKGYFKWS